MGNSVKFTDNRIKVEAALNDSIVAFLYEAAVEVEAQTKIAQTRVDTGHTKGEWTHYVDEDKGEAVIGNPRENAIWEEYGTGEYALKKNGRKGGWWAPVGPDGMSLEQASKFSKVKKDKAGNIVAVFTYGKKPLRPLQKAFDKTKSKIIKRLGSIFNQTFRE
nr:MAG TPA: hypothetical protein [Bacteriophage sp.]